MFAFSVGYAGNDPGFSHNRPCCFSAQRGNVPDTDPVAFSASTLEDRSFSRAVELHPRGPGPSWRPAVLVKDPGFRPVSLGTSVDIRPPRDCRIFRMRFSSRFRGCAVSRHVLSVSSSHLGFFINRFHIRCSFVLGSLQSASFQVIPALPRTLPSKSLSRGTTWSGLHLPITR